MSSSSSKQVLGLDALVEAAFGKREDGGWVEETKAVGNLAVGKKEKVGGWVGGWRGGGEGGGRTWIMEPISSVKASTVQTPGWVGGWVGGWML